MTKPPKNIPNQPGIYFFKDKKDKILYLGKANNLAHRIKSYFHHRHSGKVSRMLTIAQTVDFQTVNSEFEALLLEAKLIKKLQPKYNLKLKDDKRYPSIAISVAEKYPRVYYTRKRGETKQKKGVRFFGPFPNAGQVRLAISLLRQAIPFRSCHQLPQKPCLYYHLQLCPGVCFLPNKNYQLEIKQLIKFIEGKNKPVLDFLKKQMTQAADKKEYEKAAKFKKQIEVLQNLTSNQKSLNLNYLLLCDRIESYDISNIKGQEATGSMAVFSYSKPSKKDYRRFKIKTIKSSNDPAMIAEVISRRIKHPEWPYPETILIDGGKPQVAAALVVLKKNSLDIPVFGLAKKEEEIITKNGRWRSFKLKKSASPILKLLQSLRDESHRFAQSYHQKLRLKKLLLTALFFFFSLFPFPTFASGQFETRQELTYEVQEDGLTNIQEKVFLTNKTSSFYATRYNLTINTLDIKNFRAWDDLGPLKSTVTTFGETTEIELVFNKKVAGMDETMSFTFEYQTSEIASLNGKIWEINLPRIENFESLNDFQITLIVPASFGKSAYFLPRPSQTIPYGKKTGYLFTKNQLSQGKISAAFGDYQVFNFTLFYHLSNPSSSSQKFEIALPPDTAYQKVFYEQINPSPSDIQLDSDSNWLASYNLKSKEELKITVVGSIQVFFYPQYSEILSEEQRKSLLTSQNYWPVQDSPIATISKNLTSPKDVYDFILSHLDYDYERISLSAQRLGPLVALQQKKGLCLEFTDLFVTLSRSIGIPARAINGYAYSRNKKFESLSNKKNILHSWPEYYHQEKQLWIPVDPTWGETTEGVDYFNRFDFNHLTLAIHGQDSESPLAAGSYTLNNQEENDLQIQFGSTLPETKTNLEIKINFPEKIIAGLSHSGEILVKNKGNTALYNQILEIQSSPLKTLSNTQPKLGFLPPFSERRFQINLEPGDFFTFTKNTISASINKYTSKKEVITISFLKTKIAFVLFCVILITIIFIVVKNLKRH